MEKVAELRTKIENEIEVPYFKSDGYLLSWLEGMALHNLLAFYTDKPSLIKITSSSFIKSTLLYTIFRKEIQS